MKKIMLMLCLWATQMAYGQNIFQAYIKDQDTQEVLPGASVRLKGSEQGAVADENGLLSLSNVPDGPQTLVFSYVGYESLSRSVTFPLDNDTPLQIFLESGEELEEVVVTATRSSRTIDEIPTRIEVLSAEELGEKAVMNSTNIAMLLRESTGILMQQTSANSANQSIRIQGLDGRYTQLLRDGFPLYAGFAGGLSVMQIPPLDLRQVEVIKGSASTLYGGGAIAGLVNLVTKQPMAGQPELSMMLNQTSAGGTTLNGFYGEKYKNTGLTLYTSANRQQPYDPNHDHFSDIPRVRSLTINPRFYYYLNDSATLWLGVNTAIENRAGGDIEAIEEGPYADHRFTEENRSQRFSTQLRYDQTLAHSGQLTVKNSVSFFDREVIVPDFTFQGQQWSSYTEGSYSRESDQLQWIFGGNFLTDKFIEGNITDHPVRDYENVTVGAFAQNTWNISEHAALESGLRTDHNTDYGTFVLPRISLLMQVSEKLSGRIGGGMSYALPTIFTEQAEVLTFQHILPINQETVVAETSLGGNFDINYETLITDALSFSVNQMFYYTRLNDALILSEVEGSTFRSFRNADGPIVSKGLETNVKLGWHDLILFLQYAYIDAKLQYKEINQRKPLTPRHNAGAVLMFEQHGKWRIGLEAYYTGQQFLSDYTPTRNYWIMGLMGLREVGRWSVFLNFENFLDARLSRFQEIVLPPHANPGFAEIWAPTDGFVMNGGFIYQFLRKEE